MSQPDEEVPPPAAVPPAAVPPADAPPPSQTPRPPKASSTALLIRESDRMRTGIDAVVLEAATGSLSLYTLGQFAIDEQVKVRLKNIVQRFEKETRGLVRKIDTNADGSTVLAIELLSRLSALEVSLVKMGVPSPEADSGSKWV
jgi:hypothetical protein